MDPVILGFLALLGSLLFHPIVSAFSKKAASPLTFLVLTHSLLIPLLSWRIFLPENITLITQFPLHVLGSNLGGLVYYLLGLHLLRQGDFQIFYPLTRFGPILILIGEVLLLSQGVNLIGITGVVLATLGAVLLGFDLKKGTINKMVIPLILGITLIHTATTLATKDLLNYTTPLNIVSIYGFFILPLFIYTALKHTKKLRDELKQIRLYIVASFGTLLHLLAVIYAFSVMPASFAASFRNLSVLLGVYLGGKLFAEGHKWQRYMAALAIVIGAILLVTSSKF